jgi:NTE family protein
MSGPLALVLSGGGLFGAWQAGAWTALEHTIAPGLVVGASAGALNAAVIASGAPSERLRELWLNPVFAQLGKLAAHVRDMAEDYQPRIPLAVTVTRLWSLRPEVVTGSELRWQHVAASCAIPFVMSPVRIGDHLYCDGGFRNSLPIWAAVELGARRILALSAAPVFPSWWLRPAIAAFRKVALYEPPVPAGVRVEILQPSERLGSVADMYRWKRDRIERMLDIGARDAASWSGLHRMLKDAIQETG